MSSVAVASADENFDSHFAHELMDTRDLKLEEQVEVALDCEFGKHRQSQSPSSILTSFFSPDSNRITCNVQRLVA
jgi:hypothetical protein